MGVWTPFRPGPPSPHLGGIMDKVHFHRDSADEWRWTRKDEGNYKIIGSSSEGFDSYRNAYENARMNYGDTVEYVKWDLEDTDDSISVEVETDVRGSDSSVESTGTSEASS